MRKQTDFSFRVFEYNAIEEGKHSADYSKYVRDVYLVDGWEVLNTEIIRAEANSVFLGVTFVKYEDVPEPEAEAVARRGRPPKDASS